MQLDTLEQNLRTQFGETAALTRELDELTLEIPAADWLSACTALRDAPTLAFEQCMDLCAVDYLAWGQPRQENVPCPFPQRFAVVLHLMSIRHNWRLRVRTWIVDKMDKNPVTGAAINAATHAGPLLVLPSLMSVWPSVNWFEREAFDLYGIVFEGHPDLRRILTDYGFIGHPFRKDFPISGNVEMRYDPEQKRVIYQPVSIAPREVTPRIVREPGYGSGR